MLIVDSVVMKEYIHTLTSSSNLYCSPNGDSDSIEPSQREELKIGVGALTSSSSRSSMFVCHLFLPQGETTPRIEIQFLTDQKYPLQRGWCPQREKIDWQEP